MNRIFSVIILLFITAATGFSQESGTKGKDTIACRLNLMGLNYQYSQFNYYKSYGYLQYLLKNCPDYSEKAYVDGQTVFDSLIVRERNPLRKQLLTDSLMVLFDLRIRNFGNEGFILGRKGVKLYQSDPYKVKEAYETMARSVSLEGYKSRPPVLVNYISAAVELVQKGQLDTTTAYRVYDQIKQLFQEVRQYNPAEEYTYRKVVQTSGDVLNLISKCPELEKEYEGVYAADSSNPAKLRNLVRSLETRRCDNSQLIHKIAKRLFDLNPGPEGSLEYAEFLISAGKIKPAYQQLSEAIKSTDKATAVKAYILFGNLHRYYDAMPRGRTMLLKALELDSTAGKAYLVMADLYLASLGECGLNDLDKAAVYWAAADKLEKAIQLDPSVRKEAQLMLNVCKKNYPDQRFLDINGLKAGGIHEIKDCWIREKTTIRVRE